MFGEATLHFEFQVSVFGRAFDDGFGDIFNDFGEVLGASLRNQNDQKVQSTFQI
jgi:hypothetical protein